MRSYSFLKLVIILLLSFSAFAQDSLVKAIDTAEVYKKYREDQF